MQNGHIDVNIDTAISPAAEPGVSQDIATPRAVVSSPERANKQLVIPPPPLYKS